MNVFALSIRRTLEPSADESYREKASDHRRVVSLGPRTRLILPAGNASDIHYCQKHDLALVLNGYLTRIPGRDRVSDQQQAIELLLEAVVNVGDGSLVPLARELNGSFSIVVVHLDSGEVKAISDKLMTRPLWHASLDGLLLLGNNPVELARHAQLTEIDPGALASLLLYETQLEPTKCLIRGIRGQQQASIQSFDATGRVSEHHWHEHHYTAEADHSDSFWIEEAAGALRRSAERLLQTMERPMLFLSGGIDSRLAAAAIVAAGGSPRLVTLADTENIEVRVARAVARTLCCDHEVVIRDPEYYLRALARAGRTQHATHCWVHSHFSSTFREQRENHGVREAILGDHCEAFSKLMSRVPKDRHSVWSGEEFAAQIDDVMPDGYAPIDRERTLRLLRHDVRLRAEEELRQDIRLRYEECVGVARDPALLVDFFTIWRQAHCMSTFLMFHDLRDVGCERNVMFDREIQDLIERMPARVRSQLRLGARLVHRLQPQAARIPDSNTMVPLRWPGRLHRLAKQARPVLGRLRRRFLSNTYKTTASWPHLPLLMQDNESWRKQIDSLLSDPALAATELFDPDSVARCWRELCAGDLDRCFDIQRIMSVALTLRELNAPV